MVIFHLFPSIIKRDIMTSETTTAMQAQNVEVGCLDKRDVITTDGRIVGQLTGAYIDTTAWVTNGLILEVNKDVMSELNMNKPILRTPKARILPSLVKVVSDTVQLNVPMSELAGNLTVVE